jgi:RNA polymerase sigma-70 factor (ECF subfamily)
VTVEEVYRRYGTDLLHFLHGANPHLNHQDCEDLLHQAVLKAVEHMDQYDPARGSLRLWVFGILRNEVRMDLRKRRRGKVEPLAESASEEPPALDAAVSSERAAAIEEAILALPPKEREALLVALRSEGQATKEETAARLGIAPESVAVYRQRARERLREALRAVESSQGGAKWSSLKTPLPTRR